MKRQLDEKARRYLREMFPDAEREVEAFAKDFRRQLMGEGQCTCRTCLEFAARVRGFAAESKK